MARRSTLARDRILDQGLALMSRGGLAGVTLGELADRVGMSKSGVFAHFKSKDEVQIALLERSAEVGRGQVLDPAAEVPDGLPKLEAVFKNWLGWSRRAGLPGGCPVAAAMFEVDDIDGPVRDKVVELEAQWRGVLGRLVGRAVALGHLRPALDVEQFVWELCGLYLGHHAADRFLRRPDADVRAWTAFQALIERSRTTAPRGGDVGRRNRNTSRS